jgi:hypothetical protein
MTTTQNDAQGALNLKSQASELIKQYTVYDSYNRITDVYTAARNVPNNGPCTHVRYQYSGTTPYCTGMMEDLGSWSSAWEF